MSPAGDTETAGDADVALDILRSELPDNPWAEEALDGFPARWIPLWVQELPDGVRHQLQAPFCATDESFRAIARNILRLPAFLAAVAHRRICEHAQLDSIRRARAVGHAVDALLRARPDLGSRGCARDELFRMLEERKHNSEWSDPVRLGDAWSARLGLPFACLPPTETQSPTKSATRSATLLQLLRWWRPKDGASLTSRLLRLLEPYDEVTDETRSVLGHDGLCPQPTLLYDPSSGARLPSPPSWRRGNRTHPRASGRWVSMDRMRDLVESLLSRHPALAEFARDRRKKSQYVTVVLLSIVGQIRDVTHSGASLRDIRYSNMADVFFRCATSVHLDILPFAPCYVKWLADSFEELDRDGDGIVSEAEVGLAANRHAQAIRNGTKSGSIVCVPRQFLERAFRGVGRPLASGIPGFWNFEDYVAFRLAQADGMAHSSVSYWFRVFDTDDDGILGWRDLQQAIDWKTTTLMELGAVGLTVWAENNVPGRSFLSLRNMPDPARSLIEIARPRHASALGASAGLSALDLRRFRSGSLVFDIVARVLPEILPPPGCEEVD